MNRVAKQNPRQPPSADPVTEALAGLRFELSALRAELAALRGELAGPLPPAAITTDQPAALAVRSSGLEARFALPSDPVFQFVSAKRLFNAAAGGRIRRTQCGGGRDRPRWAYSVADAAALWPALIAEGANPS